MKKRREEGEGERKGSTLLDFLGVEPGGAQRKEAPAALDISEDIYKYISSKSKVSKDELFAWAKSKNYSVSSIIKAIDELSRAGRIKRRLDDEGKLVYSTA
ncbi:MAG: hypothetical protein TU35_002915 [Thermoproteus sp. AZ2]|jgi:hypothetical protein|uniref:Uncharacterized protein n=1 Tax=Thermoproteus sp. AZ2 TaxID=1609232 RepID=A0ACC6UZV6_9CREN|nr:MAG: hypothetical protein TU35_00900 [Thermoproteus sp. AZ2]